MKLDTPGCGVTESAAASTRAEAKGVHTWPKGSTMVRFHIASADPRVKSPGTPRRRQVPGTFCAGSAVIAQGPDVRSTAVPVESPGLISWNSASERLRLVRLKRYPSSPPKIGYFSVLK